LKINTGKEMCIDTSPFAKRKRSKKDDIFIDIIK